MYLDFRGMMYAKFIGSDQTFYRLEDVYKRQVFVMCIICARNGAIPAPPPTHIISFLESNIGWKSP